MGIKTRPAKKAAGEAQPAKPAKPAKPGGKGSRGRPSEFDHQGGINYVATPTGHNRIDGRKYSYYSKVPGGSARRYITAQIARNADPDGTGLDPITKFYFTYGKVPIINASENQQGNDFYLRTGLLEGINNSRHVRIPNYLSSTTIDVHWSFGGFEYRAIESQQDGEGNIHMVYADEASVAPAVSHTLIPDSPKITHWNNAIAPNQNSSLATKEEVKRAPDISNELPYLSLGPGTDWAPGDSEGSPFNLPTSLITLAQRAEEKPSQTGEVTFLAGEDLNVRSVPESTILRGVAVLADVFESHDDEGSNYGDPTEQPNEVMEKVLEILSISWYTFKSYAEKHDRQIPSNLNQVVELLILEFAPGGLESATPRMKRKIQQVKLLGYPEDWKLTNSTFAYVPFEYCNFAVQVPYCEDYITYKFDALGGQETAKSIRTRTDEDAQEIDETPLAHATINTEYNFYLKEYQDAITNPNIPEAVLPNLYVYSLGSRPDVLGGSDDLRWDLDSGRHSLTGDNRNTVYDELLTLNDSMKRVFPRLSRGDEGEKILFKTYLEEYARAVTGSVDVDFLLNYNEQIGRDINEIVVPGDEIDVLAQANVYKKSFPMFIEYSLPTRQIGNLNELFEKTYTTSQITNAVRQAPSLAKDFLLQTRALTVKGDLGNPFSIDEGTAPEYSTIQMREKLKVYDWDTWTPLLGDPDGVILERRLPGPKTPAQKTAQSLRQIRAYVAATAPTKMIRYDQLLSGDTDRLGFSLPARTDFDRQNYYCQTETIMYRVTKSEVISGLKETIQVYNFFNTSLTEIIRFVDTQVKMVEDIPATADRPASSRQKQYLYEVKAYDVVYGSEFRFRTLDYEVGNRGDGTGLRTIDPAFFSFNVETVPKIKVIEYPIFHENWVFASAANATEDDAPGTPAINGGVCFPPVTVLDRPPVPPNVTIVPYKNKATEILLNFEIAIGSARGDRAPKYYGLSFDEERFLSYNSALQKMQPGISENLKKGHLEVETNNSEEVRRIEIYRIEDLDTQITSLRDLYFEFGENLHKVLDLDGDPDMGQEALAFDCVDTLNPNTKYFYIFRSVDNGGYFSNPSLIYQVELVENSGIYFPAIKIYEPKPVPSKMPKKRMTRFLEISPSDLQKEPFNITSITDPNAPAGDQIGLITSNEDRVENNDFIIRITSIDTGRKIDIRANFVQRVLSLEEIEANPVGPRRGSGRQPSGSPPY
jgi:hypothetical protein